MTTPLEEKMALAEGLQAKQSSQINGATPGLPKLPEAVQRKHALQWQQLIETHRLVGVSPALPESSVQRREDGSTGAPISPTKFASPTEAHILYRLYDPACTESFAIADTVSLGKKSFEERAPDYTSVWARESPGNSTEYAHMLDNLCKLVLSEVRQLWGQDQSDWFDRSCRDKISDVLAAQAERRKSRARDLEIQHLADPRFSLPLLIAADGDLKIALTLEFGRQLREALEQGANSPARTDSQIIGSDQVGAVDASTQPPTAQAATDAVAQEAAHGTEPSQRKGEPETGPPWSSFELIWGCPGRSS